MKPRFVTGICISIFIACFFPAFSQEEQNSVVTIEQALKTSYVKDEKQNTEIIKFSGNVVVSVVKGGKKTIIRADTINFDRKRNELYAEGGVVLEQFESGNSTQTLTAQSVLFNTATLEGIFYDSKAVQRRQESVKLPEGSTLIVFSDYFAKDRSDVITFKNGQLTFCDDENPHWHIDATRIWLLPGGEFAFFNALLYVGVVPVPKKKKRRKGRVLVAVLLVLVLLAAGGVAALKYLKPDKAAPVEAVATDTPVAEPPTPEAEPSETSTPSASPSSSTTASATRPSTMPDLVGKTQEEAKQALPGVTVDIAETAAQNGQKLGTVISTDPKAGESLPSTGSVTLTVASNTTTIYLADLKPISGGLDTGPVDLDGKAYAHGLSQTAYNSSDHGEEVVWNLGRYFTTLNGTIGLSDRSEAADATFTIDFWVDQRKIDTKEIRFGEFQKDFSLDVSNGLRLGIVVTRTDKHSGRATVAFGDFSLQADPSKTVPDISELNKQDH